MIIDVVINIAINIVNIKNIFLKNLLNPVTSNFINI